MVTVLPGVVKVNKQLQVMKYPARMIHWAEKEKTVLVLGMHRSGTSMMSSIIQELGVDIGERLLPAFEGDNNYGYFEDCDFMELNDKILELAGGSYINIPPRENVLAAGEKLSKQVNDAISSRNHLKLWGWKDPRTAITAEVFLAKLKNPVFIVCRRDSTAVVRSLMKRGLEVDKAIYEKMEAEYTERINNLLASVPFIPSIEFDYDHTLDKPEIMVKRLRQFLRVPYDWETEKRAVSLVRSEERHNEPQGGFQFSTANTLQV